MRTNRILAALLAAVALVVGPSTALAKPIDNTPSSGAEAATGRPRRDRARAGDGAVLRHAPAKGHLHRPLPRAGADGTNQALRPTRPRPVADDSRRRGVGQRVRIRCRRDRAGIGLLSLWDRRRRRSSVTATVTPSRSPDPASSPAAARRAADERVAQTHGVRRAHTTSVNRPSNWCFTSGGP